MGKKKKGSIWLRIVIVVLAIILVLMIALAVGMNYILGMLGRVEDEDSHLNHPPVASDEFDTDSTIEGQETIETVDATDVSFADVALLEGDVINVMLIGEDRRPGEGRSRSDSMILVTLNPKKNAIQMTSFMRDLYVQIPGYLDNRLNVAYRYGGVELMNETYKLNFGLNIDGNVMVDFDAFRGVIDLLGGVTLEITSEEAWYMRNHGYPDCYEGEHHMDGEMALTFCRMRYVSDGDYGRTERQRRTLTAMAKSVQDADMATLWELLEEVLPQITTNMTDAQIVEYCTTGLLLLTGGAEIQDMRIPQDDAHYGANISDMNVLVPDLEMCREDLEEFIYSEE